MFISVFLTFGIQTPTNLYEIVRLPPCVLPKPIFSIRAFFLAPIQFAKSSRNATSIDSLPNSTTMEGSSTLSTTKRKRTRTKTKTNASNGSDRLTRLPDPVLHHILSSLDTKEVLQLAFLSKKWRYIWKFVPVLNFDYSLWKQSSRDIKAVSKRPYVSRSYEKDKCMNFIDGVLLFRDFSSTLTKLRLGFHYCYDSGRLDSWFLFALTRNIREIDLAIPYVEPYVLPSSLFTSSKIEVFRLKGTTRHNRTHVELPLAICSVPHLKTLELQSVLLPVAKDYELKLDYAALENLILKDCFRDYLKIVHVYALKLMKLVVISSTSEILCNVKLCTPNITSLQLRGCNYDGFGDLSNVVDLKIGRGYKELQKRSLMEVFSSVPKVTTLEVSDFISDSKSLDQSLLNPLLSLRCLKMMKLRANSGFQFAANILKNSPNIETLVMEVSTIHMGKKEAFKVDLLMKDVYYNHLRDVKILKLNCCEIELLFLEYLLKNASALVNLTFVCTTWLATSKEKEFSDFKEKLHSFPKASSSVTIHFLVGKD